VHVVAGLATSIATAPHRPGTSVNVGRIGGGEGINIRAREAWLELDMRAVDPSALAALSAEVDGELARVERPLLLDQAVLGCRPAGRVADDDPLVRAAAEALAEAGIHASFPPTSTDANAAHARGIPAVAVGVTTGSGEHTADERIQTRPLEAGLRALARTVERFEELSR
jgi:acetylornithine deacetylase/succinyl-diaminopimelate desuccinylase-like protein